jgi:hypothetical protein
MKYIITLAAILLFAVSAQAETFCQWTGSASTNCVSAKLGADGLYRATVAGAKKNFTEAQANEHGYYLVVDTVPPYDPATQKLGARQESLVAGRIQWGYPVSSLTAEELAVIAEAANLEAELQSLVASLSYDDIVTHVNTTFSGLSVAQRNSLIKLYRVVLYLAKR